MGVRIGTQDDPRSITLTDAQAKFLLGLLTDPKELDMIVAYISKETATTKTATTSQPAVKSTPQPAPIPAVTTPQQSAPTAPKPEPKVEPALASNPAPPAPKSESKPKATKTRKPRRVRTPIVIVDVLAPITGISAEQGKTLPSPTATCAVSSPSPTPNVQSGTGVEKIASASFERGTLNERDLADLRQRAKEVGVTGAIHKMKADTLRARIAIAEEKLAVQPVAAPVPVKPVAAKPARKLIADFLNVLPDGRELYTAVYDDGSIENELTANDVAVAA